MNNRMCSQYTECPISESYNSKYEQNCHKPQHVSTNIMPLAMAYVPWQKWDQVYAADKGLEAGTIFPELVLPFYGEKAACAMRKETM